MLSAGVASNFIKINARTYSVDIAPPFIPTDINLSISQGAFFDIAGNSNSAFGNRLFSSQATQSLNLGTVSGVNLTTLSLFAIANGVAYYHLGYNYSPSSLTHDQLDALLNNGLDTWASGSAKGVDGPDSIILQGKYTLVLPSLYDLQVLSSTVGGWQAFSVNSRYWTSNSSTAGNHTAINLGYSSQNYFAMTDTADANVLFKVLA